MASVTVDNKGTVKVICSKYLTGQTKKRPRASSHVPVELPVQTLTSLAAKSEPKTELWDSQGPRQPITISLTGFIGLSTLCCAFKR